MYNSTNAQVTTNVHTSAIKQQFYWMILVNKYELLLLGKGGTIDGTATFTSQEAYYSLVKSRLSLESMLHEWNKD